MTVNILKTERSYHICAMQKALRIFSSNLQFGTLKQGYLKIFRFDFEKKRKIYGADSLTDLETWIFQDYQNIRKINH